MSELIVPHSAEEISFVRMGAAEGKVGFCPSQCVLHVEFSAQCLSEHSGLAVMA